MPVIKHLKKELVSREVLHCDETPVQVLKEKGKKPQSKSYMWLYRTGSDDRHPVVLYDYQPSRSGNHAVEFLEGFHGYLHTDGYSGYNKLEDVTRCGCWAHLRRKFVEAVPGKKAPGAPPTAAEIGRDYCDKLFRIENQLKGLSVKERYLKRLELEKPVLEAFWCWLDTVQFLKGSALGKAVIYAGNQKPYMENYLLDGRCALSNNAAENAIRQSCSITSVCVVRAIPSVPSLSVLIPVWQGGVKTCYGGQGSKESDIFLLLSGNFRCKNDGDS